MKLRSYLTSKRLFRHLAAVALLSWPMFTALVSLAEERKFLVILANMPRSFPAEPSPTGVDLPPGWIPGQPPIAMPGAAAIEEVYFSHDPEDELGSFAEYWEEISCGIVRVTGKAIGIVELPWPQYPIFENETTTDDMVESGSIETDFSPATGSNGIGYFDLTSVTGADDFQFGEGEVVREGFPYEVLYKTDFQNTAAVNGDLPLPQYSTADDDPLVAGPGTEDSDGDGKVDLGVEDLDSDGQPDFGNEDLNMNCQLDLFVSEDCQCGDCDGTWTPAEDCNGDGVESFVSEDLDNDGHLDAGEACLPCTDDYDSCLNGDGASCSPGDDDCHPDVNCDGELSDTEDLDSDGNFETATEDTNGDCVCAGYPCVPDETPGFNPPLYWPIFTPGERFR
ncbi:MAG: hypothetical protein IID41_15465, partial [Planctomycetes bacterium]|nr:hypothetical protein [Planctomycetota bacterium]